MRIAGQMAMTRSELMARLAAMDIHTTTIEHPPAFTVADSATFAERLPGADTKNLFVKDEDGTMLLIVANTETRVDLKYVARRTGVGRLSFARPDRLLEALGVTPGSVTAFAIANDVGQRVRLVFDQSLMSSDSINCHPLENSATTNIARGDLLRFIRSTGHDPVIMPLNG